MSENNSLALQLSAEKALIWRITHIRNVPWISKNGLHCASSSVHDDNFIQIGNPEIISKRFNRAVSIGKQGVLSDYIPFYFTPFSPMMYNIHTGMNVQQRANEEIAIIVSSLHMLENLKIPYIFTDAHVLANQTNFYEKIEDLSNIRWDLIQQKDFKRDPNNPRKSDAYQAEVLVHKYLPTEAIKGIICYSDKAKNWLLDNISSDKSGLQIYKKSVWYF